MELKENTAVIADAPITEPAVEPGARIETSFESALAAERLRMAEVLRGQAMTEQAVIEPAAVNEALLGAENPNITAGSEEAKKRVEGIKQAAEKIKEEIGTAGAKLEEQQGEIATIYARRENKIGRLFDLESGQNRKVHSLHDKYLVSNQKLFKMTHFMHLINPKASREDKLRLVSNYLAAQGRQLEAKKRELYEKSRSTRVVRALGKSTLRSTSISIGAGVAVTYLTAGAATGVVGSTMMYSRLDHIYRQKRENEASGLDDEDDMYEYLAQYDVENGADVDVDFMIEVGLMKQQKYFEQTIKREQRRRARRVLGSVALGVGVGTAMQYAMGDAGMLNHYVHSHIDAAMQPHATIDMTPPHSAVVPPVAPPVEAIHGGLSNIFAHQNMGWYEVLQQMGVDPSQRHDLLLKAAPDLVRNHFAYTMSNGLPGVPTTGYISQSALNIIAHAAGR